MKISIYRPLLLLAVVAAIAAAASAQSKPNQTLGYGEGKLLTFTYTQNFDCIDQPGSDLNFNGIPAESDPAEMQTPICQVGTQPTIKPAGDERESRSHDRTDFRARPHVLDRQRSESQRCDFVHERCRGHDLRICAGQHANLSLRRAAGGIQGHAECVHAVSRAGFGSRHLYDACVAA